MTIQLLNHKSSRGAGQTALSAARRLQKSGVRSPARFVGRSRHLRKKAAQKPPLGSLGKQV
eukprot:1477188-Alexandrium_andersonii.AAC.1